MTKLPSFSNDDWRPSKKLISSMLDANKHRPTKDTHAIKNLSAYQIQGFIRDACLRSNSKKARGAHPNTMRVYSRKNGTVKYVTTWHPKNKPMESSACIRAHIQKQTEQEVITTP